MTATEHLAEVVQLHCPVEGAAREYRTRVHGAEPPHTQPVAHLGWAIEQQLVALYDAGRSPYDMLAAFPPMVADAHGQMVDVSDRASALLNNLLVAADEVADAECDRPRPSQQRYDRQADALDDLAACLRGA